MQSKRKTTRTHTQRQRGIERAGDDSKILGRAARILQQARNSSEGRQFLLRPPVIRNIRVLAEHEIPLIAATGYSGYYTKNVASWAAPSKIPGPDADSFVGVIPALQFICSLSERDSRWKV